MVHRTFGVKKKSPSRQGKYIGFLYLLAQVPFAIEAFQEAGVMQMWTTKKECCLR
jgi:hypothetical protein